MRAGTFPVQVNITARCVAWRAAEVDAWCESRQRTQEAAK
jgi:predicted DNA-binding transcriptional regulator AlpA